jgi:hypothetical protein
MPEKIVHVSLRLPPDVHRQLMEWADREHRSLHAQVLHTLLEALDKEGKRRSRQQRADAAK